MDSYIFEIKVIPNSKMIKLSKEDKILKLKIIEKAVDNKANEFVISYLAEIFNKKKKEIEIIKGATTRNKLIKINNLNKEEFEKTIEKIL